MFTLWSTRVFKVITRVSIILITREITRVINTRVSSLVHTYLTKKCKNHQCGTTFSTCMHKILSFVIPLEVFPPAAFTHVSDGYTANGPTISLLTITNQLPNCTYSYAHNKPIVCPFMK